MYTIHFGTPLTAELSAILVLVIITQSDQKLDVSTICFIFLQTLHFYLVRQTIEDWILCWTCTLLSLLKSMNFLSKHMCILYPAQRFKMCTFLIVPKSACIKPFRLSSALTHSKFTSYFWTDSAFPRRCHGETTSIKNCFNFKNLMRINHTDWLSQLTFEHLLTLTTFDPYPFQLYKYNL